MKVDKNKVVTMTYVLRLNDEKGEVIQKVDSKRPFVHLFGAGTLLPTFESNLKDLEAGAKFGFPLTADEAYGSPTDEAIIDLEKSIFEIDGIFDADLVEVGKVITMQDQNGRPMDGKVLEVKDDVVVMDFNHPLAGENLYFSGEIIEVRKASEEELSHGHVHGDGGHHH